MTAGAMLRCCLHSCLAGLVLLATACGQRPGPDAQAEGPCETVTHLSNQFIVCSFDTRRADIRLFQTAPDGSPYGQFERVSAVLAEEEDKTLVFAMNGGMYHEDRRPVGYFKTPGDELASVNMNEGPGNFHMKPNGVFWVEPRKAGILESSEYLEAGLEPSYATQSGPMLVIDGNIHPAINPTGTSRKRRNGVGVEADGRHVHFAISEGVVTFHDFATLFRDRLDCPDALFLDGQVSRIYAPDLGRVEQGLDMGPIVGVVE